MKISIHTTITNPEKHQYPWREALASYLAFADEVVVVDGGSTDGSLEEVQAQANKNDKLKIIDYHWPQKKWDWSELPKHLNRGLEACTGDFVMKFDIDYIMHEDYFDVIRQGIEHADKFNMPGACLVKFIVLNRELGYQKCFIPFCINKKLVDDKIKYGRAEDKNTDHCYPVIVSKTEDGVPVGTAVDEKMFYNIGFNIYCYDYFFRTKKKAKERFWKFADAYKDNSWGATPDESWEVFIGQEKSRLKKAEHKMKLKDHPVFVRERVKNMRPEYFGYNNWDNLKHETKNKTNN